MSYIQFMETSMTHAHFFNLGFKAWQAGNRWLSTCLLHGWQRDAYQAGMWAARELELRAENVRFA